MLSRQQSAQISNFEGRGPRSASLSVVAARSDNLSPGFYVGRRRSWLSAASWTIVFVGRARPDTKLGRTSNLLWVYAPGVQKASRIQDWLFRDRILGIGEISQEWREMAVSAFGLSHEQAGAVGLR